MGLGPIGYNGFCLIHAHDDVANAIMCGDEGVVFSGSTDRIVKLWQREARGKWLKHATVKTLLNQRVRGVDTGDGRGRVDVVSRRL
ncbi:myosin heavy chain kinase B [Spatholobus suberectus]|nr:myosin heavy chain kinase B [Spatholobus suberectus]